MFPVLAILGTGIIGGIAAMIGTKLAADYVIPFIFKDRTDIFDKVRSTIKSRINRNED